MCGCFFLIVIKQCYIFIFKRYISFIEFNSSTLSTDRESIHHTRTINTLKIRNKSSYIQKKKKKDCQILSEFPKVTQRAFKVPRFLSVGSQDREITCKHTFTCSDSNILAECHHVVACSLVLAQWYHMCCSLVLIGCYITYSAPLS